MQIIFVMLQLRPIFEEKHQPGAWARLDIDHNYTFGNMGSVAMSIQLRKIEIHTTTRVSTCLRRVQDAYL